MNGYIVTANSMEPIHHDRNDSYASARSQAPLRLLSLDGGGVRGYSMILLLEELMVKLFVKMEGRAPKKHEIPKPCDHFDLIAGTGTGGLIALLIGRLRLSLEVCKRVYVEMTQRVFQTDKTIAGLPYRKTLFKASKLEEAIKEVVRDVTSREQEDDHTDNLHIMPRTPPTSIKHSPNFNNFSFTDSSESGRDSLSVHHIGLLQRGNEDALLYDSRLNRCKTFVTAVYKDSDESAPPAILRTYDSPAAVSSNTPKCTIWQAGRATSATFPAFKPITIDHSTFLDEGTGRFSPVAQVLEEAMVNEWPGRPVGLILSIGSGKRPDMPPSPRKEAASHLIHATPLRKFAEAREKHIAKVQDCEEIHQELLQGIHKTGVPRENYVRLNVEVGVGDVGMNEWRCLADIKDYTRSYLRRPDVQSMNSAAADKLAAVCRRGRMTPVSVRSREKRHAISIQMLNRDLPKLPVDAALSDSDSDSEMDEEIERNIKEVKRIERIIRI
ncbi:hypothetical protein RUND412_003974 [Rhizina undulata]